MLIVASSISRRTPQRVCGARLVLLGTLVFAAVQTAQAEDWKRFRGPDGAGISKVRGIPTTWTEADYAFNIEIPGEGHSSPVISGQNLLITSAVDEGAERYLWCLDADSGDVKWSRRIGMNRSHKHSKSSWASGTPTLDGDFIYVPFADREHLTLACYSLEGELVWRRVLGEFDSQHGHGVSPVIYRDLVILPNDQKGPSSVMAFNKHTGELAWSTLREIRKTSYATPFIYSVDGGPDQLICASGAMALTSLDPLTGIQNWQVGEFPLRTVASPVRSGNSIIATCGGGGVGKLLICVRPQGSGGLEQPVIEFERDRTLPYVPTPVAFGDHVYLWSDKGIVSCIEAATGENLWTNRVKGDYSGSPVCIDGSLYCISEEGDVVVIAAEPEFQLRGTVSLGDFSHATPAVGNDSLYLRTFHRIMRLPARDAQ